MNKIKQSSSDRPPVKCFSCLELGLIARDCKKDLERKGVKKSAVGWNERNFFYLLQLSR